MATHIHNRTLSRQHGSALIVSLLILLVLTLIGVAAMSTTVLQGKMATNSREYNTAFQATESALRDGENEVYTATPAGYASSCNPGSATQGLCLVPTTGSPVWSTIDWTTTSRAYGSESGVATLLGLATNVPRYIIEKLPLAPASSDTTSGSGSYNGGGLPIQNYRITAIGSGANGTASVMLQSVFRP